MAAQTTSEASTGMKPTLGLTGVTINAMALIAPGAFLWTTFQAQSSQVIGHVRVGVRPPEEGGGLGPEIAVAKSSGQMGEAGNRLQERHDARVTEAQGRDALTRFHRRGTGAGRARLGSGRTADSRVRLRGACG